MVKRKIGKTNVKVNAIGLGGLPLSIKNRPSEIEAIKVIHAAIEAGVELIDTANVYCLCDSELGHNERLIQKALQFWPHKQKIHVATKGGIANGDWVVDGRSWVADGRPKSLRKACENSLKALQVNEIFLYQLHAPDDKVPFEESVGELSLLQEEGKIQHIGISNVNASEINRAQKIVRIETVQNRFSPLCQRDFFNGVLEACQTYEMTYIAYSPVGGYRKHVDLGEDSTLKAIAREHGASPYQVILSWCLAKGDHILPIPGASKISSILSSVEAMKLHLNSGEIKSIDEMTAFA